MNNEAKQKIGVFMIEGNQISSQGMRSAISQQQDIEIVGQASNAKEALSMTDNILPKSVVVHSIPPKAGFGLVSRLREVSPEVSVIILAEYEDDELIFHAIMAGASAFLTKENCDTQLFNTIRSVFNGERPIIRNVLVRPKVALQILKRFSEFSKTATGLGPLVASPSFREKEVLKLISEGYSTKPIASSLNTTEQAIEGNVTTILRKLNVNERTRSAVEAIFSYGAEQN